VFFFASKIFWMIASPINLLLLAALVGVLLCFGRHARFGRGLALTAILILVAAAILPVGVLLIAPLEDRFPVPSADLPPPEGIIALGGAINDQVSAARQETVFDEGGERLTEAVILAKRYPQARVVYTGGTASFVPGASSTEALQARKLMSQMGIAPERVTIEDKSRNTDENARFTADRPSATFAALDHRHLRLSYAARDGRLREGRISADRLSRGFSHSWSLAQ
jgi:uncharacterized SAM-binding protein YcdF (DUF218 family)